MGEWQRGQMPSPFFSAPLATEHCERMNAAAPFRSAPGLVYSLDLFCGFQ